MNNFNINPLKVENLAAQVKVINNTSVVLLLTGSIDMRDTSEVVLPYFLKVHDEILSNKITTLKLDLVNLNYVNSNGIRSLISWLMKLNDLTPDNMYKVIIVANKEVAWQESTLPVLQKLFPDKILIETI